MWKEKYLNFAGHVALLQDTRLAVKCLSYRDLTWWRQEQSLRHGVRHNGRFKPWRWEDRVFDWTEKPWRDLAQGRER